MASVFIVQVLAFAWRAILTIRHNPEHAFDVVVTPVMFTVMFTYLFGGALVGSTDAYLDFLLPGILVQTVMFTSIYTGFILNQDIRRGACSTGFAPCRSGGPRRLPGAILGDVVRDTVSAVLVLAVGMGFRIEGGAGAVLAALVLLNVFALGIGWIFTALALMVRTPGTVMTLSWLVLMPVTFGSNIYVGPETMPGWLQSFVAVNPVSHITTALRGLLGGDPSLSAMALALVAPFAVTAVFGPVSMWLYGREK